jgi:hypothetical protein
VVVWENARGLPQRVLIVKKLGNREASRVLLEMAAWLEERGVEVRLPSPPSPPSLRRGRAPDRRRRRETGRLGARTKPIRGPSSCVGWAVGMPARC